MTNLFLAALDYFADEDIKHFIDRDGDMIIAGSNDGNISIEFDRNANTIHCIGNDFCEKVTNLKSMYYILKQVA